MVRGGSFFRRRSPQFPQAPAPALRPGDAARTWLSAARDFVLPAFCVRCGAPSTADGQAFFCATCWARWPAITGGACRGCGRPRERQVGYAPGADFFCVACSHGRRPLRYVWAAARYDDVAGDAIRAFKYQRWDSVAHVLGPKLADLARARVDLTAYTAVVPVPLHWRRSWWRGFNQAALLAKHVTALPGAPAIAHLLRRTRYTIPQSRLEGRAREQNLRDAFALRRGADPRNAAFLLVDDVTTTGTTLVECARVLRRAGARHVDALTLAATGTVAK